MKSHPQQATSPPGNSLTFPIVGVGASAGGLEALELFLSHVPKECGMAFVIVQHLSPDHSGNLTELLQRSTTMKVQQVKTTIRVRPDCVYVITSNFEKLRIYMLTSLLRQRNCPSGSWIFFTVSHCA